GPLRAPRRTVVSVSPARERAPRLLQLARDVVRDADAGDLRVPVHARECAVRKSLPRQDGFAFRVEQDVQRQIDIVARHAGPSPTRAFVPVAGRPSGGDDAPGLLSLAEKKHAVAAADLLAARAAPVAPEGAGAPQPRDVATQIAPGVDPRIPRKQKRPMHSGGILPRPQPVVQLDPLHLAGGA